MNVAFVLATLSCSMADTPEAKYQFAPRKGEDSVEVRKEKDRTVFAVTSKSGIGGVIVTLVEGNWPGAVVLRMQYEPKRGFAMLESFGFRTNRLVVSGSQRQSGQMELSFVGPDGKQGALAGKLNVTVQERDGALEVTLPQFLLTGAREVSFSWIDAYRR